MQTQPTMQTPTFNPADQLEDFDAGSVDEEQRELDLNDVNDLGVFVESAEDVYADAAQFESLAQADAYEQLSLDDITGLEIYDILYEKLTTLQEQVDVIRYEIIPAEQEVPDEKFEYLQNLYDDMLLLRDHVRNVYAKQILAADAAIEQGGEPEVPAVPVTSLQMNEEVSVVEATKAATPAVVEPVKTPVPQPVPAPKPVAQPVPEPTKKTPQRSEQVVVNPDQTLETYRSQVREEMAQFLKKQRYPKIKRRLDSTIGKAKTIAEIDTVKNELLNSAEWKVMKPVPESAVEPLPAQVSVTSKPNSLKPSKSETKVKSVQPEPKTALVAPEGTAEVETVADKVNESTADPELATDVTLLGLSLPKAGPTGVTSVHAFRSGLLTMRDRHPSLVSSPDKQLMVDKLIRKLANVPKAGLVAETDLLNIIEVAERINGKKVTKQAIGEPAATAKQIAATKVLEVSKIDDPEIATQHKEMKIDREDREDVVAIHVAKKTKDRIEKRKQKQQRRASKQVSEGPSIFTPRAIVESLKESNRPPLAAAERQDPINQVVPERIPTVIKAAPVHEQDSLTEKYLQADHYQAHISKFYTSVVAYERMLDTTVTQIEARTIDPFERWFDEEYSSAFAYLKELSLTEVEALNAAADTRQQLAGMNVKYESFIEWMDIMAEMQSVIEVNPATTFGELFARWMVEGEIQYVTERQLSSE